MKTTREIVAVTCAMAAFWIVSPALADTCFVAKAESTNPNLNTRGTAIFILNQAETEVEFNVICCGDCSKFTALFSQDEGLLFYLSTSCPNHGVWNLSSQVPLTTDRVQDLKDGKLKLLVFDLPCYIGAPNGVFLLDPCEREAPPEYRSGPGEQLR